MPDDIIVPQQLGAPPEATASEPARSTSPELLRVEDSGLSRRVRVALVQQSVYQDGFTLPSRFAPSNMEVILSTAGHLGPAGLLSDAFLSADFVVVTTRRPPANPRARKRALIGDTDAAHIYVGKVDKCKLFESVEAMESASTVDHTQLTDPADVDWGRYDIVVALDAAVPSDIALRYPEVLWAYYVTEACMPAAQESVDQPLRGYDVFLTQNYELTAPIKHKPHVIEMPYTFVAPGQVDSILAAAVGPTSAGGRLGLVLTADHGVGEEQQAAVKRAVGLVTVARGSPTAYLTALRQAKYCLYWPKSPKRGNVVVELAMSGCLVVAGRVSNSEVLKMTDTHMSSVAAAADILERLEKHPHQYKAALEEQQRLFRYVVYERPLHSLLSHLRAKLARNGDRAARLLTRPAAPAAETTSSPRSDATRGDESSKAKIAAAAAMLPDCVAENMRSDGRKRVLVTGGAGFIAFHLQKQLATEKECVVGYDNFSELKGPIDAQLKQERTRILEQKHNVRVIPGDLCDRERLRTLFALANFTHVVNLAAEAGVRASVKNPNLYVTSNVQCFVHLLEVVRHYPHTHVSYASSSSVYGSNTKIPFSERDRVDKQVSVYAATKKSNEALAHVYHDMYGVKLTGLRFFTVYGPLGRADMAYFFFTKRIFDGEPITVFNNGTLKRDFTYVADIVAGIIGSMNLGAAWEVFNLGNNTPVLLSDFVSCIESAVGKKAVIQYASKALGDVEVTFANISHAKTSFGYQPNVDLDEGILRFVEWYRGFFRPT